MRGKRKKRNGEEKEKKVEKAGIDQAATAPSQPSRLDVSYSDHSASFLGSFCNLGSKISEVDAPGLLLFPIISSCPSALVVLHSVCSACDRSYCSDWVASVCLSYLFLWTRPLLTTLVLSRSLSLSFSLSLSLSLSPWRSHPVFVFCFTIPLASCPTPLWRGVHNFYLKLRSLVTAVTPGHPNQSLCSLCAHIGVKRRKDMFYTWHNGENCEEKILHDMILWPAP